MASADRWLDKWLYVERADLRFLYEAVPGDDMACDETRMPGPKQPGDHIISDLVALRPILAELGLVNYHIGHQLVDRLIWRPFNLDQAPQDRSPHKDRLYRIGDPRHKPY